MRKHILKSWPEYFSQIVSGKRVHELRENDREFNINDKIELHEFENSSAEYTGRVCCVEITSLTSLGEPCAVSKKALHPDYCILSIKLVNPTRS